MSKFYSRNRSDIHEIIMESTYFVKLDIKLCFESANQIFI